MLRESLDHEPQFVLINGDLVEEGEHAHQWRHFVGEVHGVGVPLLPSLGNHDDDVVEGDGALYNRVMALPRNDDPGSGSEDFYYFLLGDAIIVTLSTCSYHDGEDFSLQARWLDRVFREHPRTWKIVQYHHPTHSTDIGAGTHPPNEVGQNDDFIPILDAHHVDVVIGSHNHVYERFRPLVGDPDSWATGQEVGSYTDGTLHVVTGGMGAPPFYLFDAITRAATGSEVRTGEHHYLVFRIGGDRLELNVMATRAGFDLAVIRPGELVDRVVIVKPASQLLDAARCAPTETFDGDEDGYFSDVDCDDSDPQIHPGAAEVCDGRDNYPATWG